MKPSLFFLPITPRLRSALVPIIPLSRSSLGPAFALLSCSILPSKPWENLWRSQASSPQTKTAGGRWSATDGMRHLADPLKVIFRTRDKNRTRKREFKGRAGVGFWEAIISTFSFIGGRLFQEGDYQRNDYHSRKYGNCAIKTIN